MRSEAAAPPPISTVSQKEIRDPERSFNKSLGVLAA